jgi:hypothetical protein
MLTGPPTPAARRPAIELRAQACGRRLDKAIAAGQIRGDLPTDTMVELLYGSLYYRTLLTAAPLTARHAAVTVQSILTGLGTQ